MNTALQSLFVDCLTAINRSDPKLLADHRLPLIGLDACLRFFDLPPLPAVQVKAHSLDASFAAMAPTFKDLSEKILQGLRQAVHTRTHQRAVHEWAEKLMRFCEVRFHSLKARAAAKTNSTSSARLHLLQLTAFLMDQAIAANDARLLNTVLKLTDWRWLLDRSSIKARLCGKGGGFVAGLFQFRILLMIEYGMAMLCRSDVYDFPVQDWETLPEEPARTSPEHSVVILSPSRFSLYTLCACELLLRRKIHVKAIVVRKLVNPERLMSEYRRDGSRLIRKILRKLILRTSAYKNKPHETIADFMQRHHIGQRRVEDFRRLYGIPIVYCRDLNDDAVISVLKKTRPEVVVFTGGGLLRKAVLEHSGAGVLNCHMGVLPPYRGMDVVEWPVLEGNPHRIGMTVHFMDQGVDTGDILSIKKMAPLPGGGIKQLRDRFEPEMCRQMVAACDGFLRGRIQRQPQGQAEGRQYFIMHRRLTALVEVKLKKDGHPACP